MTTRDYYDRLIAGLTVDTSVKVDQWVHHTDLKRHSTIRGTEVGSIKVETDPEMELPSHLAAVLIIQTYINNGALQIGSSIIRNDAVSPSILEDVWYTATEVRSYYVKDEPLDQYVKRQVMQAFGPYFNHFRIKHI